jgi:glucokinase
MYYLGIDVGGTQIKAGVVDERGAILQRAEAPTGVGRHYSAIIADMAACCQQAMRLAGIPLAQIGSLGVGIPGIADNTTGTVIFCTNLGWHDVPLRQVLQRHLPLEVWIDNDATLAGYAESVAGISKGLCSSVFLTLGTGVGGGIVIDGKPWAGAHGVGSEIGHATLVADGEPCTCGKRGCVERYCSATALIRMAQEACTMHASCAMMQQAGGDMNRLTGRLVVDLAKAGDPLASQVFLQYAHYLALTVNSVISFLDPEMIVLGGGISNAGEFLTRAVEKELPDLLMFKTQPYAKLALASLGNDAGIIGAAMIGKLTLN